MTVLRGSFNKFNDIQNMQSKSAKYAVACSTICESYSVPGGGTPCGTICVQYCVGK